MAYLAPIHRPSSVRHALKLNFLAPDEECLVVAKANRLEIYAQTIDGLTIQHTKAIYGKVSMLHKLRPAPSTTDHLFVGTDRFTYFTLSWDSKSRQLRTEKSFVDQADKSARDSQTGDRCLRDPTGRFMTLELFEGVITVLPIVQKSRKKGDAAIGSLGDPVPSRISELFVRSSAFLYPRREDTLKSKPKLALLYEDNHNKVRVKARQLEYTAGGSGDPGTVDLEDVENINREVEAGASHLIPVPTPICGMLILGETSITYLDESNNEVLVEPLREATIFVEWECISPQQYLLADDYGKLYMLFLMLKDNKEDVVQGWKLDVIGETSRASVLVYLDNGYVFVGSHEGDSQVIKLEEKSINLVQSFSNIAPILDFTVMDMGSRAGEGQTNEYSSGQARIVTGSGAFKDGSLRSVRSGVGLEEQGILGEMENITDLFSLRSSGNSEYDDSLVVSFVDETRVFCFSPDGDVEELEDFKGLSLSEGSLLTANIPNQRILQVTASSVRIVESDSGMVVSDWAAPETGAITAASANEEVVVLSIEGTTLLVLDTKGEIEVAAEKTFGDDSQISCVTVPSPSSPICVVGFWQSAAISVLGLDKLNVLQTEVITDQGVSVPRSVLMAQIFPEQPPILFVAMADGNVITFTVSVHDYSLSGKKSIVLGTQQANFRALPRGDGLYNILATCEHPSLIYGSEGRLVYSAVTVEKASCVCPFNSEAYPRSVAIATSEDLKIATVDTERTTHVQTLPLNETVRRVAYSTQLKAFGLGTIKRTLEEGAEVVQSHFKLADEVLFKELDTYALNEDELVESVVRAELPDGTGDLAERFVVGTAYLDDERDESIRGRILVFEITADRLLKVVTELSVKGACRALGIVDGKIVAALVKTVVIYAFEYESSIKPFLSKRASYRTATAPIDIAVTDNLIAIADLMKSVSIVKYIEGKNGLPDKLTEVARHFQTTWGTAVANVAEDTYLESDAEGNLMVLHQNTNGVTEDDRRRLEITSEMLLGEMVNRIRRITVPTTADATVIPRAFLATVEGSIYLFALVAPSKQDLLMRLQSSIATYVRSPGHMPFAKFRAFKNTVREAEEPFRFVDGELIERFLDCGTELQEEIVGSLGVGVGGSVDVEGVRGLVEGLRRLH
ncbi:MAG: hypothetical protein M1827_002325 [Pycnora praestabilis]|nr:MAG: hypothetical protein M1827_002325 [Pycnora praestabilis]